MGRWSLALDTRTVLTKELRGTARGWRLFGVLTGYLCFLSLPLLVGYLAAGSSSGPQRFPAGRMVFLPTVGFELGLVCFIAPVLAAGAIAGERERQTYDLLVSTPLSSAALVLGKLLAALAYLLLLVVAALPLQAVALWLGGVSPEELIIGLILVLVVALAYGSVGIFFSALLPSTVLAIVLSYVALLLLAGGPPLIWGSLMFLQTRMGMAPPPAWISDPAPWFLYLSGAVLSLNPVTAGAITEAFLVSGRPAVLFWETLGKARLLVISPWLVFSLLHVALAVGLVAAATRRVRKTGSREERKRGREEERKRGSREDGSGERGSREEGEQAYGRK